MSLNFDIVGELQRVGPRALQKGSLTPHGSPLTQVILASSSSHWRINSWEVKKATCGRLAPEPLHLTTMPYCLPPRHLSILWPLNSRYRLISWELFLTPSPPTWWCGLEHLKRKTSCWFDGPGFHLIVNATKLCYLKGQDPNKVVIIQSYFLQRWY